MPYYARGDYYRGDYYRGDPGLFSFLGGIAKTALHAIPGVGTALDVGTTLLGLAKKGQGVANPTEVSTFAPGGPGTSMIHVPAGGLGAGLPGLVATGFGMGYNATQQAIAERMPSGVCDVRGHRLNKSTYVTRGGGTSRWPQGLQVHPKGTECVKTRRMNVANPRALRRALRRASGFAKLARRYIKVTRHYKPKLTRRRKK